MRPGSDSPGLAKLRSAENQVRDPPDTCLVVETDFNTPLFCKRRHGELNIGSDGDFSPLRLLLKLHTALHAKIKQREIKENLRYHESAVLNVQDGRYSHRIGKE